ncbi:MAG: SprT-like domain-containing protein [Glaciecola sp.]
MALSYDDINTIYEQCKTDCFQQYPIEKWKIKPRSLIITDHKTKYGMAFQNGDIAFNRRFINSKFSTYQLIRTLCHELAHLAAGLEVGHGKWFKELNDLFSQQPLKRCAENGIIDDHGIEFKERVGFSYWLVAQLDNGDTVRVKPVHRRSKQYINYSPSWTKRYRLNQHTVIKFHYEPYN